MTSSAEATVDSGSTPGNTIDEPLHVAISDRYLQYALSTIMNRALPDARDGLKPVHRRILYAMRELKLDPGGRFRKCSKISGDVMGNYHPHGDQAIYDALARLAQEFTIRYPLVDGQGNFGNIDGDNPAAARYTEARLTKAAMVLMDGLAEDAVDFRENYDGSLVEPVVLPASFPNILANGSSGIAVGMATSIPPHNIGELCDAALHLIRTPAARDDTLLKYRPGAGFSDRRRSGRTARKHLVGLQNRAGVLPAQGALARGETGARAMAGRRDRDPVPGAEKPVDREDRGPGPEQENTRARQTYAMSRPRKSAWYLSRVRSRSTRR